MRFTDGAADFGIPMLHGAKLAVDEINSAGGHLGRPLELVVKDDTANPDVGLQHSQDVLKEGVVGTIGFCNTGVAMKSLETFQTVKAPLIVLCATGTPITAKYPAPESYIFRTSARDGIQAPFVVEDIVSRVWNKVAIFADKTPYGEGAKDAAEGALMAQTFIAEPSNERRISFLSAYARKYNTKKITVPMAAAQAYDTVYLLTYAILSIRNGNLSGPSVKAALEAMPRIYYGVTATHERPFSKDDKDAITSNMLVMGLVKNGAVTFAYPEDRTRNLFVQRKR